MAARKFIDETGLALLNTLLKNAFDSKMENFKTITTLTNANTLTETGVYGIRYTHNVDSSSNLPATAWGVLLVFNTDITGTAFQIYITDGQTANIYKRNFSGTTFGSWVQITENTTNARTPTSHASSATTYGIGTTANYGHCKVINNLTTSSASDGNALQAYQGYLLNNNKQAKITYSTTDLTAGSSNLATGEFYAVYE